MRVYLIENGEGLYKVGRTKLDVSERIRQLQTGSPYQLEFVAECLVNHPSKVEAYLHRKYRQFHVSGEWFALPMDVVREFVDDAARQDEIFTMLIEDGNPFL